MSDAPQMRKPVGVEGMDVEHRHTRVARGLTPARIAQGLDLHPTATKSFDAVAGAADHQQMARISGACTRHVHGQRFTLRPRQGVGVRLHRQSGGPGGIQELAPSLAVAFRKGVSNRCHVHSWVRPECGPASPRGPFLQVNKVLAGRFRQVKGLAENRCRRLCGPAPPSLPLTALSVQGRPGHKPAWRRCDP